MKKNQKGSAMIVVICVMVVAVALSVTLLLTASILINNAIRSGNKEQCRINAITVSELLIEEIGNIRYDGLEDLAPGESLTTAKDFNHHVPPLSNAAGRGDTLAGKLKTVVTKEWYSYDPDAGTLGQLDTSGKDFFTYWLEDCGLPGETKLELYWMDESGENLKNLDMGKPFDAADKFQNLILYIKVTSTVGEESSAIISTFNPVVQRDVMGETGDPALDEAWTAWMWNYRGHEWERGNS